MTTLSIRGDAGPLGTQGPRGKNNDENLPHVTNLFFYSGSYMTVYHNMSEERLKKLFRHWAWKTASTDEDWFLRYVNSNWINRIMGWRAR